MTPQDARQYAPATKQNREPILEVLLQVLPENGTILEILAGLVNTQSFHCFSRNRNILSLDVR
jgi:Protein of unknown function (DUF938)